MELIKKLADNISSRFLQEHSYSQPCPLRAQHCPGAEFRTELGIFPSDARSWYLQRD